MWALQCDASLHLLSAYNLAGVFAADTNVTQAWLQEMRGAQQEPFEALADAEGVAPDCRHFMEGGPVQVIREQVVALGIDALVMGVVQPKGGWTSCWAIPPSRLSATHPAACSRCTPMSPSSGSLEPCSSPFLAARGP